MLDNLYENIGGKIKNWAKWIFIIEAISAIIGGFILLGNDRAATGLIVLFAGPVIAWVSSWLLYAFGQLVDDVNALRFQNAPTTCNNEKNKASPTVATNEPLENSLESNVQYKAGNCELCGQFSEQLVYCKIVDDLGVRYRTICRDCIVKYGATPQK